VILLVAIDVGADLVGQVDPTIGREGCKAWEIESRNPQRSVFEAGADRSSIWGGLGLVVDALHTVAAWCWDWSTGRTR